jgi:hypothetical protein
MCRYPRADFGSDMTISRLPKLGPQVLEQSRNLGLTVKLAEQKEVWKVTRVISYEHNEGLLAK